MNFPRRGSLFITTLILAGLLVVPVAWPEESNVNPEINRHYQNADYEYWVRMFERPGREVYDRREAIVDRLALRTGMAVADIGAGTGLFTRLMARQVGSTGKVYAVDIAPDFVSNILRTAREQGLNNVEGIVNDQKETRLAPASIDLAFLCDTYHHFEYPLTTLASIHRALRPGGRLVIIDFRKQPGVSSDWVMSHTRLNKDEVIREVTGAGFDLQSDLDILQENFYLVFRKP